MQINFDDAKADLIMKINALINILQTQKEYLENVTHDELKERYAGTGQHVDIFHSNVRFVVNEIDRQYKVFLSWIDATDEQMKAANKVKEIFNLVNEYGKAICPNDASFIKLITQVIKKK